MRLSDEQITEYEERGYLFFPSLFSDEEVAALLQALPELMARTGPEVIPEEDDEETIKMVFGAHLFNETFRRLSCHPQLLVPTEQLLDSRAHVFQSRLTPKMGFTGGGWGWHQDFNQWYRQDGMQHPRALMVAIFLDEINVCNAPLMAIPGSNKVGHIHVPDRMEIDFDVVEELANSSGIDPLMGPAGSVVFMNCITVHGSAQNMSPWPRRMFYFNYNSVENTAIEQRRDRFHCSTDFTPLIPLGDDCLMEAAVPAGV